jgi:uncharacterized protein DUF3108
LTGFCGVQKSEFALFAGYFGLNDGRYALDLGIMLILATNRAFLPFAGLFLGLGAVGAIVPAPAHAQGRVDAKYEATLSGIAVGKGTWTIEIGDDVFSASAQGGSAGLLKAFSGGSGSGASQGRIVNGALVGTSYVATTTTSKKSETIRLTLANGGVKDFSIDPVPPVDADRIVVTDAHRKNVLDPMTGSMIRVPGTGEVLTPDACRTGTGVFDGRLRYDLKLDYKRMETVKAEHGYHGPAVVCAIYFTPVAGYIPDRPVIKWLAAQRNMEITFVPVAGTRVLVPFRMMIPTPLGPAMLEATTFVTTAAPPRVAKTQ